MRTRYRTAAVCTTAVLLAHALPLAAQGPSDAGFVLSVRGPWFTSSQPTRPLGLGQPVLAGDSVWAGEHADYLNLMLFADDPALGFHCSRPGDCTRRHPIVAERPGGLGLGRWLRALRITLGGGPDRFSVNLTRGDPRPEEAVVIRGPAGVDLAPVLNAVARREVLLSVAALDTAATARFWEPLRVSLTPGRPALVAREFLPPGLYAIRMEGGQLDATWVLVMDDTPAASDDAAAFRELSARLRNLNAGRHDEDTLKVLRATLYHLALRGPAGAAPSSP